MLLLAIGEMHTFVSFLLHFFWYVFTWLIRQGPISLALFKFCFIQHDSIIIIIINNILHYFVISLFAYIIWPLLWYILKQYSKWPGLQKRLMRLFKKIMWINLCQLFRKNNWFTEFHHGQNVLWFPYNDLAQTKIERIFFLHRDMHVAPLL